MRTLNLKPLTLLRRAGSLLILWTMTQWALPQAAPVGTWVPLVNTAPLSGSVSLMLLLSDGTILCQNSNGTNSYRLIPDNHGSYVNGTWLTGATPNQPRLFFSSAVLRDGRVFIAGGEYGAGAGITSEIYNPAFPPNDSWTPIPVPAGIISKVNPVSDGLQGGFRDSTCVILANGTVLIAPVYPSVAGGTVIYNPFSNTFTNGPVAAVNQNEATWLKLPDDSILMIDPGTLNSERYIPSLNQWIPDAHLPVQVYSTNTEVGAALLLPNGKGLFLGGTGNTALYTPSGNTDAGSWASGPSIPNGLVARDAPAAMMSNGKVLCAFSPTTSDTPISFYEYDSTPTPSAPNGSFAAAPSPTDPSNTPGSTDASQVTDQTCMLSLPDGTILYSHRASQLYVYTPGSAQIDVGKPAITGIIGNGDGSYTLKGTGLNGNSSGASFGDDAQMDSNYPLVRLSDGNSNIYYARTYNWSSTGVQTGNTPVTTEFTVPALPGGGIYSLVVSASGVSSDPISFPGPVWVDFTYTGFLHSGSAAFPYKTLTAGVNAVSPGGTILIRPGSSPEALTISKPMILTAIGGAATIGR